MTVPVKASAAPSIRRKAVAVVSIYIVLLMFCLIMAIYDFSTLRYGLGIMFSAVAVVFGCLILLKLNTVFGTYIKAEDGTLYMKSWVNNFLPYDINGGFLSDLKPSRTKLTEIPISDISLILIGRKDYVKQNAMTAAKKLARVLYPYEHKRSRANLISTLDLFYVETAYGECSFMCVHGYDTGAVMKVVNALCSENPDLHVKIGSSAYKKHMRRPKED